jgi:RNA polymerase sigma factor (sigma-70 family)
MNLLKSAAARLVEGAMEQPLSKEHLLQVTEYLKIAKETKDVLVASNMRLAIKVANRFSRASHVVDDLVSIGCETLMRACETYDCSRPFSFYTYAMRALFSNYSRFMQERKSRAMVQLTDVTFQDPVDQRSHPHQDHAHNQLLAEAIGDMLTQLSERERLAIGMRALDEATFLEIGNKLGISKQGAQGVVNRALSALQRRAGVDPRDNLL